MNMHHLAYLEGNPEQPYGIHLQLQSQAFYRMMIQHYYEYKLGQSTELLKRVSVRFCCFQRYKEGYPTTCMILRRLFGRTISSSPTSGSAMLCCSLKVCTSANL